MKPAKRTLVLFGVLSVSLQAATVPQDLAPSTAKPDTGPAMIRVATVVERVERDRREIRVYEASRALELPWFTELAIATPIDRHVRWESLPGSSVGLIPTRKNAKEWELYTNVVGVGGDAMTLADNVFRLKKVIVCTPQHAVELRMDGWTYRLKSGQVLLVLG